MGAAGGPLRMVLTVTVPRADAEAFERAWARVADWTAAWPGCLRQTLGRAEDRAGGPGGGQVEFEITSDWADAARFHAFERSRAQDEATAELRRLRTGARMRTLQIRDHREVPA
ncbi:antibiotic biosynthesis monooxygenase family protein [Actinomadura kijaniata]|uniref:antibiotic biosynthesis monooxygenase family protein n=1 Tax=Actinomadura kijaniata TaxID=46161 RepID=UPI003F1AE69A